MNEEEKIDKILKRIETEIISTCELRKDFPNAVDLLKNLERSGLINRTDSLDKIASCKWSITSEGKSFLKLKGNFTKPKNYEIVMTLPPTFKEKIIKMHPSIKLTDETIRSILLEAKDKIKILSPYVDASIIDYLKPIKNNISIEFLTTNSLYGKNMILERLKQTKPNLKVKYLIEKEGNIQKFQTHAKIIIIDKLKAYIGSANFKDTSMLYNLEGGVLLSEPEIIQEFSSIFDDIFLIAK